MVDYKDKLSGVRAGKMGPMVIMLAGCFIVLGGIFGWKGFVAYKTAEFIENMPARTVVVSSTNVATEEWAHRIQAVGGLSAYQGVEVTTEVAGQVASINFESGSRVEEGALLVQLDDSAEQAQLKALQAEFVSAKLDYERAKGLVKSAAVSKAKLDRDKAKMDSLAAQVEGQSELVRDKAIRAPFAGELGIRQVNVGEYVSPGTEIVTLQNLSPIYVNFTLPEHYLNDVSAGQMLELEAAAFPGEMFTGMVTAVSPKIDQTTRNIELQATISNEDGRLRPGMFVQLSVVAGSSETVMTLPQTAVIFLPYGNSVYLIKEEQTEKGEDVLVVYSQQVETGRIRDGRVEIISGVKVGEEVVGAGQIKLRNGQFVTIDNSVVLPQNILQP